MTRNNLPEFHDWRDRGVVTTVKDQKQCASCYAFAANAALESAMAIKYRQQAKSLSIQEIMECSAEEGNDGCKSGWFQNAWRYVMKRTRQGAGQVTETAYPYEGKVR